MKIRSSVALVALALVVPWSALAWSGFTHQYMGMSALRALAENNPGARVLLTDGRLLTAFLGGLMAVDVETGLDQVGPQSDLGALYHSDEFADTLLSLSGDSHEALAFALGWKAHILQDGFAHGEAGYAVSKRTFTDQALSGDNLNHTLCEAMLDIIVLSLGENPRGPSLLDAERVAHAARLHGHHVTAKQVKTSARKFRWAYNRLEAVFLSVVRRQKNGILPSVHEFYADAWPGLTEGWGINRAIEVTIEALEPRVLAFSSPTRTRPTSSFGRSVANVRQSLESRLLAPIYGNERRADWVVAQLAERGFLQRTAVVDLLIAIISTDETDFTTLVRSIEADCIASGSPGRGLGRAPSQHVTP